MQPLLGCFSAYENLQPDFIFSSNLFVSSSLVSGFALMDTATSNCTSQPASDFVSAPTAPGLGYPLDFDALDKMLKRVDK